jgi:hypothetical protein
VTCSWIWFLWLGQRAHGLVALTWRAPGEEREGDAVGELGGGVPIGSVIALRAWFAQRTVASEAWRGRGSEGDLQRDNLILEMVEVSFGSNSDGSLMVRLCLQLDILCMKDLELPLSLIVLLDGQQIMPLLLPELLQTVRTEMSLQRKRREGGEEDLVAV